MVQTKNGNLGPYVFENIEDGVLLLTANGTIAYINKSAQAMLGIREGHPDLSFPGKWLMDMDARNDEICEVILDAVYDKQKIISKKVKFYNENGELLILHIKSSYWQGNDSDTPNGVVLIMQDITSEETLKKEKEDAIFLFSVLLVSIGVWNLFYAGLKYFKISIPAFSMTYILLGLGMVLTWVIYRHTNFSIQNMGLSIKNIRKPLIFNLCVSASVCLIMIVLKAILIKSGSDFFPEGQPFWDFRFTLGMKLYPISVIMQEFLSQGIIHECLMRILNGKNSGFLAILLSSVLFTALHIHRGFAFMIGSLLLVCIIGILYRKQRTIWGLCITHYSIPMVAYFLNWL